MEAEPVDDLPRGKGWLYEPKYDGFRCLAFRDGDKIDLQSKKQKSLNVRGVVDDPKVSTHSLRHNMNDRLRKAGVSKIDQDLILGHTMGGIGEAYGGDEARLEVAAAAMKEAFSL